MIKILTFEKDPSGEWYVILPEYLDEGGSRDDLQMVAGADYLLDELSLGKNRITIKVSDEAFPTAEILTRALVDDGTAGGAYYLYGSKTIWLCPVLEWLFEYYPYTIYFKPLKDVTCQIMGEIFHLKEAQKFAV